MLQTSNGSFPMCGDYLVAVRETIHAESMTPIELKVMLFSLGLAGRAIAFGPRNPLKPPTKMSQAFTAVGLIICLCQLVKDVHGVISVTPALITISGQYHLSLWDASWQWIGAVSWIAGVSSNVTTVLGAWILHHMDEKISEFGKEVGHGYMEKPPSSKILILLAKLFYAPVCLLGSVSGIMSDENHFNALLLPLILLYALVSLPIHYVGLFSANNLPALMLWIAKRGSVASTLTGNKLDDGSRELLNNEIAEGLPDRIKQERERRANEHYQSLLQKIRESPYGIEMNGNPFKGPPRTGVLDDEEKKQDRRMTETDARDILDGSLQYIRSRNWQEELEYFELTHAPMYVWEEYYYYATVASLVPMIIFPLAGRVQACGFEQGIITLLSDQSRQHYYAMHVKLVVAMLDFFGSLV